MNDASLKVNRRKEAPRGTTPKRPSNGMLVEGTAILWKSPKRVHHTSHFLTQGHSPSSKILLKKKKEISALKSLNEKQEEEISITKSILKATQKDLSLANAEITRLRAKIEEYKQTEKSQKSQKSPKSHKINIPEGRKKSPEFDQNEGIKEEEEEEGNMYLDHTQDDPAENILNTNGSKTSNIEMITQTIEPTEILEICLEVPEDELGGKAKKRKDELKMEDKHRILALYHRYKSEGRGLDRSCAAIAKELSSEDQNNTISISQVKKVLRPYHDRDAAQVSKIRKTLQSEENNFKRKRTWKVCKNKLLPMIRLFPPSGPSPAPVPAQDSAPELTPAPIEEEEAKRLYTIGRIDSFIDRSGSMTKKITINEIYVKQITDANNVVMASADSKIPSGEQYQDIQKWIEDEVSNGEMSRKDGEGMFDKEKTEFS